MCRRPQPKSWMKSDQNDEEKNIPALARLALFLNSCSPKVTLFNLDFGVTLMTMTFFATMRLAMKQLLAQLEWPIDSERTSFAAACIVGGIFHTPFLVSVLAVLLTSQPFRPSASFSDYPRWWQDTCHTMLQVCTAYMIYDFFTILWDRYHENGGTIVLNDDDPLYMAHHFMTMFYMISVRAMGAGQGSALICMFLGEVTNPFFNTYLVLQEGMALESWCCKESQWFTTLYPIVEFLAASSYVLVRAAIGPVVLGLYTCFDLLLLRNNKNGSIPLFFRILYIVMIWGVLLGSMGWVEKFRLETLPPYWDHFRSVASGITGAEL